MTLADVARLAGVSIATASKALNGRAQVRAETRERVVSAARQLSFTPNALARGLLLGRSGTVGLVTHDLEGRFSIPILAGAEDAFGAGQMSGLLTDARGDTIRERYQVNALLGRSVDGLIVVGDKTDERPSLGHDLPVPVVYAYAPSSDPSDCSLVCDNVGAGRMGVEHLLGCGRSRIAIITGDPTYGAAHERVQGALAALAQAGLELIGGRAMYGSWTEDWGRGAARLLVDRFPAVDAILCGSDQVARGVLDALRERGLSVPGDIAVVGHDNWKVMALGARPTLTTIDMNLEELGRLAATRLVEAIDGHPRSGRELVTGRLITRNSTAPQD
ncbi:MAG: LacI family transcriptional regulator [Bifidobacteriaceae bacterium]|nr:LacI family transcriptional regulator [Bifidobacteriaceae bacterium]